MIDRIKKSDSLAEFAYLDNFSFGDPVSKFRPNCGSSVDLGPVVGPRPIATKKCLLEL